MKANGFAEGTVVYLDIDTFHDKSFQPYFVEWKSKLWDLGYYGGAYVSYLMADWIKELTSAVWTFNLPPASKDGSAIMADKECQKSLQDPFLMFENGILKYDPSKNPHGVIPDGCIATQYLHCQRPADVTLPTGVYCDLNWSKVADPSDLSQIEEFLNLKKAI
jgi:hypothetical protein